MWEGRSTYCAASSLHQLGDQWYSLDLFGSDEERKDLTNAFGCPNTRCTGSKCLPGDCNERRCPRHRPTRGRRRLSCGRRRRLLRRPRPRGLPCLARKGLSKADGLECREVIAGSMAGPGTSAHGDGALLRRPMAMGTLALRPAHLGRTPWMVRALRLARLARLRRPLWLRWRSLGRLSGRLPRLFGPRVLRGRLPRRIPRWWRLPWWASLAAARARAGRIAFK
jgi:hypothetical protein